MLHQFYAFQKSTFRVLTLFILAAVSLMLMAGCDLLDKQEEEEIDPAIEVDEIVQQFIQEAEARGLDVADDVNALDITLQERVHDDDGDEFCGYVPVDEDSNTYTNQVLIATNDECWDSRTAHDHETLVFHELGHAVLDRFHNDDLLPNGDRASIMVTANPFGLYGGEATLHKRPYYVDELFDPGTPVPDWAAAE